jgi:hypothetical protein
MTYTWKWQPGFTVGNITIPKYLKVTRTDGSYYYLGWQTIGPQLLRDQGDYWMPEGENRSWTTIAIGGGDGRASVMRYQHGNSSGATSMQIMYRNPQKLVPFAVRVRSSHWRDGGGIRIVSNIGNHVYHDSGGSAAYHWENNILDGGLSPELTDRKFMLDTYGPDNAYFFIYARRHDIHNDDHIQYECALSMQQYWEPEEFYLMYGLHR